MSGWSADELTKIANAEELDLASRRADGSLGKPVTIWVVRHGDDLYVRAWRGRTAAWFRGVQDRHEGHIRAGGVDKDVLFIETADADNDMIDAAYRTKYHRYADTYVAPMVVPQAHATTLMLVPQDSGSSVSHQSG